MANILRERLKNAADKKNENDFLRRPSPKTQRKHFWLQVLKSNLVPMSNMHKEMGVFTQLCVLKSRDIIKNGFTFSNLPWINLS